jgi:hypothetical protein
MKNVFIGISKPGNRRWGLYIYLYQGSLPGKAGKSLKYYTGFSYKIVRHLS